MATKTPSNIDIAQQAKMKPIVPLARERLGIPEEDLKALFSKEQWERWTTTDEFTNAKNYWNNIRQNHQNRRGIR